MYFVGSVKVAYYFMYVNYKAFYPNLALIYMTKKAEINNKKGHWTYK